MDDDRIALEYLLEASETALQDAMLKQLELATIKRKEIAEGLEEWAKLRSKALLFEWFLVQGSELMARVTTPAQVTAIEPRLLAAGPGPMKAEELRESLRKLLNSA